MFRIYKIERSNVKELKNILASNPYDDNSFARKGYTLREGKSLNLDEEFYYLFINADEDFIKFADERLKNIAIILNGEEFDKARQIYEDMENAAQQGFGALFG